LQSELRHRLSELTLLRFLVKLTKNSAELSAVKENFLTMRTVLEILTYFLPVCYFLTVWLYAKGFFSGAKSAERAKTRFLVFSLLTHLLYLVTRTSFLGHPPITSIFELMTLLSFCIAAAYLFLEQRTKVHETGYFILNLSFIFQLISSLFIRNEVNVNPILQSNWLGFHVTSALLGYAAIAISAVYGFLYLMLYHEIKASRFGVIYKKLPSLEVLEGLSSRATAFGFTLLTAAIVIGVLWLSRDIPDFSYFDSKLIGTFLIWILYGGGILAKRLAGWKGRKMMILSVSGFALAFFSLTIINIFFSEFHAFY
jgi:ABC-type transport system involved in cytochrome c biogenesis permease subunit